MADKGLDPANHLLGGPIGESKGANLLCSDPLSYNVSDSLG